MIAVQFILLTVAWTHGCIGLYFWLRLKPFFKWAAPFLLAVAVLLPPLAMLGAHHGAQEAIQLAKDPQWRAAHVRPLSPEQRSLVDDITLFYFPIALSWPHRPGVCRARRACAARASARHDHGLLSRPAGARAEGFERARSEPALQRTACLRLRRPGAMLHLPHSRCQRSRRVAAAIRSRIVCAHPRRRSHRSRYPAGVPAASHRRRGGHSRCCRRMSAPISSATGAASISARNATSSACSSTCAARPSSPKRGCRSTSFS